jgi:DNA-binding HxlR family transcriptional regulator
MSDIGETRSTPRSGGSSPSVEAAVWGRTVQEVLTLLGRKWVVSILIELSKGPRRHFQLVHALGGVQSKVLTETLRFLESDGIVKRVLHGDDAGGKNVAYKITPRGRTLLASVGSLFEWGRENLDEARPA